MTGEIALNRFCVICFLGVSKRALNNQCNIIFLSPVGKMVNDLAGLVSPEHKKIVENIFCESADCGGHAHGRNGGGGSAD